MPDPEPPPARRTRRPFRREAVIAHIRGLIVAGTYGPGERLPTRQEIAARCGAPPLTVQDAFDRLVEQGHVEVAGRNGSFASTRPPHRQRFVVAFHGRPGGPSWGELWQRADDVARRLAAAGRWWVESRYDVARAAAGLAALDAEVADQRVAGILFVSPPFGLGDTPTVAAPGVQRVVFGGIPGVADHLLHLELDVRGILARMLAELVRGRAKRPAWLVPHPHYDEHGRWLRAALKRHGMANGPHLHHLLGSNHGRLVPALLHLLFRLPPGERPDSLVVGDDNLLPVALATLAELGVAPGDGFQVVAHANFPLAMAATPGVRRVGFSIPQAVERSLECMAERIASGGGRIPRCPAYRDDEVDAAGLPLLS